MLEPPEPEPPEPEPPDPALPDPDPPDPEPPEPEPPVDVVDLVLAVPAPVLVVPGAVVTTTLEVEPVVAGVLVEALWEPPQPSRSSANISANGARRLKAAAKESITEHR